MNLQKSKSRYAKELSFFLIFSLATLPFAFSQSDEKEDPWFTEKPEIAEEETDSSKTAGIIRKGKSPRALYNLLIKQYEDLPEGNISKRISTLEEAISISPKLGASSKSTLEELRRRKAAILSSIDEASQSDFRLESAIESLSEHTLYLLGDSSILFKLLDSPFIDRLDSRIRVLGRNNEFDEIARLERSIASSGLNRVIGDRFNETMRGALASIIERRWDVSSRQFSPLTGEAYLVGRLIGAPEKKMTVQLEFPNNVDAKLSSNISRSLERAWGDDFQIRTSRVGAVNSDLILEVDVQQIETTKHEDTSTVASSVPGKIVEEPNPEFMEMVKKYEKSAKGYELAMKNYDVAYDLYLEGMRDDEYDRAQRDVNTAQAAVNTIAAAEGPGAMSPQLIQATLDRNLAQSLANSIPTKGIPEPQRPFPHHLEILDELYVIPSTIVTSSESTPYEYTAKELEYRFNSKANLVLKSPASQTLQAKGAIDLKQDRKWTKNEGIHRSDPTAEPGSYSESELNSAMDLFSLEFGTSCSKEFGKLLDETRSEIANSDPKKNGLAQVLLGLSIGESESKAAKYSLSNDELRELANLARSSDNSVEDFRLACLTYILEKSGVGQNISNQDLQELL